MQIGRVESRQVCPSARLGEDRATITIMNSARPFEGLFPFRFKIARKQRADTCWPPANGVPTSHLSSAAITARRAPHLHEPTASAQLESPLGRSAHLVAQPAAKLIQFARRLIRVRHTNPSSMDHPRPNESACVWAPGADLGTGRLATRCRRPARLGPASHDRRTNNARPIVCFHANPTRPGRNSSQPPAGWKASRARPTRPTTRAR